jgi:hypothetical protein
MGFDPVHDYEAGKLGWLAFGLPVEGEAAGEPTAGSLAVPLPTCGLDELHGDLAGRWRESEAWCAAVDAAGVVLGRLRRPQLADAPAVIRAREVMDAGPSTYRPSLPAGELLERMERGGFSRALVTDPDGRLLGVVQRSALAAATEALRRLPG